MSSDSLRKRLLNFCLWHLARRELSQKELKEKLTNYIERKWPADSHPEPVVSSALIESVLAELQDYGYQNDARAAQSVFRSEVQKGRGPRRVQQTLAKRGLSAEPQPEQPNWLIQAARLRQQKFGELPERFDPKLKAKQTRFLAYRGYSYDVISKVLSTPLSELEEYF